MVPPPSRKVPRVLRYSGYCVLTRPFMYGAFTLSGRLSQNLSIRICQCNYAVRTPQSKLRGLGSSGFARRYYRNRVFFLFLRVLRWFSSPRSLHYAMDLRNDGMGLPCRVSPFGYLRIIAYVRLPEAFRSLSRPSSALSAKASALCSL